MKIIRMHFECTFFFFFYSVLIGLRIISGFLSSVCPSPLPQFPALSLYTMSAGGCSASWVFLFPAPICKVVLVYIFIYALEENLRRCLWNLLSGIQLGGAASTMERRINSWLDALEKQMDYMELCFIFRLLRGFICHKPG